MSDYTNNLKKIISFYGNENQMAQAMEELSELSVAINHMRRFVDKEYYTELLNDLCEEIADVEIMIEQLKLMFHIDGKSVESKKEEKLFRQLLRIKRVEDLMKS